MTNPAMLFRFFIFLLILAVFCLIVYKAIAFAIKKKTNKVITNINYKTSMDEVDSQLYDLQKKEQFRKEIKTKLDKAGFKPKVSKKKILSAVKKKRKK